MVSLQGCSQVLTSYESAIALRRAGSLRRCCASGRCCIRSRTAAWQRRRRRRWGGRWSNRRTPRVWPGYLHRGR